MEKASTVITDALQELLIQASEAPIEADEAQTAIRYLNRMMARFDAQGISLGFTIIQNLGDYVTIPDGAYDGVVKNLAISLAKQYGATPTQDLYIGARDGLNAMRNLAVTVANASYGSTLPMGSGNQGDGTYTNPFYPASDYEIETEDGRTIGLEGSTELN